jgi:hypothetical protein
MVTVSSVKPYEVMTPYDTKCRSECLVEHSRRRTATLTPRGLHCVKEANVGYSQYRLTRIDKDVHAPGDLQADWKA